MISLYHETKSSSNIKGKSPWRLVTILPGLVAKKTVVAEISWEILCHVISQEKVTKWQSNIMGKKPLRLLTILPSLMTISNVVMLEKLFLVYHVISQDHIGTVLVNIYNGFSF